MKLQQHRKLVYFFLLTVCVIQVSCKKSWLDAKPDKALVVPTSTADFWAILDNNTASQLFNLNQPSLSEIGAGDFTLTYESWQSLALTQERNAYIWNSDIYASEPGFDWNTSYNRILYTNIVLDGVAKVGDELKSQPDWKNIKGTALFFRAYDFFNLVQLFAKSYDANTASVDLGIPLRLTSDITIGSQRATVQQTYDQIINDLLLAKTLLPPLPAYTTRAGKCAVFGLLSRVFLSQNNFSKSLLYADSCLQLNHDLMDYNSLDTTSAIPISRFNKEVVYHHNLAGYSAFDNNSPYLTVEANLYSSYNSNDLRKVIFFKEASGSATSNGSYSGDPSLFGGMATDEMYLIRAECYARQNNTMAAMRDLNSLLTTRWKTGTFIPYTATSADEALSKILNERRKELVFRGIRWSDLKRLNQDSRYAVTLTRNLNGKIYTLSPNDNRYVFPIPPDEIRLSGLQQNPR